MSSRRNKNRRRQGTPLKPIDLWRPVPQLDDPAPIAAAPDPTMIFRSLGDPPLHGQGAQAGHEVSKVLVRAAQLAEAVAAASGLRAEADDQRPADR